ncbi:7-carboxy-7-deazaguanine synthase QueE [Paenibacillus sp. JCM 10914]|uniref:7-carboxy-7-deazaguanine synthase QueE n=1 Tax=Paenibacillus sp. JCM 10914 TaxID=1236974 RepID=UPI0003CC6B34|nr:7-carboxy-7-deazaguanine synthase QueE [Paenibacillus sp. JCM 10914]GAE07774.1 queuosine Biosynthesis QueE Radical SAM [Paenibacillus sp. JCM 10914]
MNSHNTTTPFKTNSATAERPIPVMEIFGPTVQGEGMVVGRKTMFVRTAGCDYRCSWCDSAFTWDGSATDTIARMSAQEVWQELYRLGGERFDHVTLSGGNPALLSQLGSLIDELHRHGITIAVETQGSRWQDWLMDIDEVTISPKPPSSGMTTDWGKLDEIVSRLSGRPPGRGLSLKVVVFDDQDLAYAETVHERYPNVPFYLQTGNPDVRTDDKNAHVTFLLDRYEQLVDAVMQSDRLNDVRVLPQLHTLVWSNKRGV